MQSSKRRSKYNNRKTIIDDVIFDSISEAQHYVDLKQLKVEGKIQDFDLQPEIELQPGFIYKGKKFRPIKYVGDFRIFKNDGSIVIQDVKGTRGYQTDVFKLKMKMLLFKFPNINFEIVVKNGKNGKKS